MNLIACNYEKTGKKCESKGAVHHFRHREYHHRFSMYVTAGD